MASDNFDRTDCNPLTGGAEWSTPTGGNALQIVSNQVKGTAAAGYSAMYCSAVSACAAQSSTLKLATNDSGGYRVGPAVRMQAGSVSGYRLGLNVGTGALVLFRMKNGSPTQLGSTWTGTQVALGDAFTLLVDENFTFTVKKNGVLLSGSYTDSDTTNRIATGIPGIMIYGTTGVGDDWEGAATETTQATSTGANLLLLGVG